VAIACKEHYRLHLILKDRNRGGIQQNLAESPGENQWVMLDFYADWCASCQEMALYTFADSKVRATLSQVVLVQADVTQNSPTEQALLRPI